MTLQFILGTASQPHIQMATQQAKQWLDQDDRHQVYMIVPNNIKFEMEFEVLKQYQTLQASNKEMMATTRMQNFSFSRLAWSILKNQNAEEKPTLDHAGVQMLVKGLLRKNSDQLQVFRSLIDRPQFGEQLAQTLLDFVNAGFTPDILEQFYEQLSENSDQSHDHQLQRWHDMTVLYRAFYPYHNQFSFDNRTLMNTLADFIWQNKGMDYTNTLFIFYGFHHFDAYELPVLEALINKSQVLMSLKGRFDSQPDDEPGLFYSVQKTKQRLEQMAKHDGQSIKTPIMLEEQVSEGHRQMEAFWQNHYGALSTRKNESVSLSYYATLWKCDDKQTEIEMIARKIIQLVKEEGYRYKDMTIMTNDITQDKLIIEPIFKAYHIPVNISDSQYMAHHPLVEWLEVLLTLVEQRYHVAPIFRLLRTELYIPETWNDPMSVKTEDDDSKENNDNLEAEEDELETDARDDLSMWYQHRSEWRQVVDLAERFQLANDYKGYDWYRKDEAGEYERLIDRNPKHQKDHEDTVGENAVQALRCYIMPHLEEVQRIFSQDENQTKTTGEVLREFYEYIETSGVKTQLYRWQQWDEEHHHVEQAKKHAQVWQSFIHLLDEYYMIFEEEPFEFAIFKETLLSGLLSAKYNMVPSTLDEVSVVNKNRQRGTQTEFCFYMSCSSATLPMQSGDSGILDDHDHKVLEQFTTQKEQEEYDANHPLSFIFLGTNKTTRLLNEAYFAYETCVFPKQHLWISYDSHNREGEVQTLSPYIRAMKLTPKTYHLLPSYRTYQKDYVSTLDRTLSLIVSLERQAKDEHVTEAMAPEWNELSSQILTKVADQPLLHKIKESLTYSNIPSSLIQDDLIESLYAQVQESLQKEQQGKHTMQASISKLETFNQCPYRFFLQYGLGLREREIYDFDAIDRGNFYHKVLEKVTSQFMKGTDLTKKLQALTEQDKKRMTHHILDQLRQQSNYEILRQPGYMEYLFDDIQQRLERVINHLVTMAKTYPQYHRSEKEYVLSDTLLLNDKWAMDIHSKIDRLDIIQESDSNDLSFILMDYKSGDKSFNLTDIYYGIALQLLTYVDLIQHHQEEFISDKAEASQGTSLDLAALGYFPINPTAKRVDDVVKMKEDDKYKLSGFYVEEHDAVSPLFGRTARRHQMTQEELQTLESFNRQQLVKTGQQIVSGNIAIHPYYHDNNKKACQYCPFHDICQFDPLMEDNHYRYCKENINNMKMFIEKIKPNEKEDESWE